ncbi:MAG: class I SAM-dependent methyltransferase [Actinomycetota bacterium]|nr:class I SAM-dependent methyltransferase [Actinomycetota bacterium]
MEANAAESARWNNEAWTTAWPKREVLTDSVTPVLLEAVRLQPGERVLDVGCGGGKTTMAACQQVQPGGSAVGADFSEALLALAATRAAGMSEITWQRADMQTDHLPGDHFDVALSQFGVMFFDEPVAAFANLRQHLRTEGRLAFACWQAMDHNPWFVGPALAPFVAAPPSPAPGKSPTGPFALGAPDRAQQILGDAGFGGIHIEQRSHEVVVPESAVVDDAQLAFMGVSAEAMGDARSAVASMMEQFATRDGLHRFPLAFQIVTARVEG